MDQLLESQAIIRFQDCDPFKHLNNSKYFEYFLNAREDQLILHYDLDIYDMASQEGKSWIVTTHQIAYLSPALMMEKVIIQTQVISYSPKNINVEMKMWDEGKSQMKSLLWSNFVHFDLTGNKVIDHSEEFMDLFKQVHLPIEQKSFNERLLFIRSLK